jgi:hypothetical protein
MSPLSFFFFPSSSRRRCLSCRRRREPASTKWEAAPPSPEMPFESASCRSPSVVEGAGQSTPCP